MKKPGKHTVFKGEKKDVGMGSEVSKLVKFWL